MNREYREARESDSPRFDDRNDHSNGPVRSSDNILQGKRVVENVVGQVYRESKFLSFPHHRHGKQ